MLAPSDRLTTLPEWDWEANQRTLGFEAVAWAELYLTQPNGPRAGQPFRFTRDQFTFLLWWYAVDDRGDWLYSHGVRRLAKGSGKSPFAAVLALIELCAPVRLERFDDRLPGGCKGKPVDMPLVQIAATTESQTANTMRMVRAFAPKGSEVVEAHRLDPGKTKYYRQPEGTLEVITSSATAAEGAEASFVIGDESEHWKPNNDGPNLAATLQDNLAKSGNRMVETANAWLPGTESVAESSWEAWVAQEEGKSRGETAILYDCRVAPPDTDMSDADSLRKALQHVYADCDWKKDDTGAVNVRPIMERIWTPSSRPDDSMRKYLNWPTVSQDSWVTPQDWAKLRNPRIVDPKELVVLFFDGSKSSDTTALVGCCISDGYVFVVNVWEPDPKVQDDVVNVEEVDETVTGAFDLYNVVGFFGDVQEWESFVKVTWPKRFAKRLKMQAQPTGRDQQLIAWDMRTKTMEFTRAVELVEQEIRDSLFEHDGNPIMGKHVSNCRRRPNRWGVSIGKESRNSVKKVDAAVCMVGARMMRRLYLSSQVKETKPRTGIVRGIR